MIALNKSVGLSVFFEADEVVRLLACDETKGDACDSASSEDVDWYVENGIALVGDEDDLGLCDICLTSYGEVVVRAVRACINEREDRDVVPVQVKFAVQAVADV